MSRILLTFAATALMLVCAVHAHAAQGTWATDAGVGSSELSATLTFGCTGGSQLFCDLLTPYSDTQVSTLSGSGPMVAASTAGFFGFSTDGTQDIGDPNGPVDAYLTATGTNVTFAAVPIFGVPEFSSITIFSISEVLLLAPGLDLTQAGDTPLSGTLQYSGIIELTGDLAAILPSITITPTAVPVTGTFRVTGGVTPGGDIEYEILNLQGTLVSSTPSLVSGSTVTTNVTAAMTLNLSGAIELFEVPALPAPLRWALLVLLGASLWLPRKALEKTKGSRRAL